MFELIIDNRERDVFNNIQSFQLSVDSFRNIKITKEPLLVGDFIIRKSGEDVIIFERKSIKDLVASIKDGRYSEQSLRLNSLTIHNHNIVYIIEGKILPSDKKMVMSAITSLSTYKGFSVIRVFNLEETAFYILNMVEKMANNEKDNKAVFYSLNSCGRENDGIEVNYASCIKKKKNDNITCDNFGEIILNQIPNVSSATSIPIMNRYGDIFTLITALCKDNTILNDITTITKNGLVRKANKSSISNIVKFLTYRKS